MAIRNPYEAYQKNSVTTASPGELTLLLYNGCLKFIKQARLAITEGNISERNKNLQKAQSIISELLITLNMDIEVSKNMAAMYEYVNRRMREANLKNDEKILDEVVEIVVEFRDTWKAVIQANRQQQHGMGGKA